MTTTYEQLTDTISLAQKLHRLTRDPLLLSAITVLTPHLQDPNPDAVELPHQATLAFNVVHLLEHHRSVLFS
jgi:hypothetical protein